MQHVNYKVLARFLAINYRSYYRPNAVSVSDMPTTKPVSPLGSDFPSGFAKHEIRNIVSTS